MADAFRERLLNVLTSLRPPPSAAASGLGPPVTLLAAPTPQLSLPPQVSLPPQPSLQPVSTVTTHWPPTAGPPTVPWTMFLVVTLLASLGLGMALATLIWKHKSRSL